MPKKVEQKQVDKKQVILVTGATSGLGIELIGKLLLMKNEVRIILRDQPRENSEWKTLPKGVKVYVGDIRSNDNQNTKALLEACEGVNVLLHLAAATTNYVTKSYNELVNTNVVGTENILKAYIDANPDPKFKRHFIYTSSVTIYGYQRKGEVLTEESEPMPASAYAESKYMAEQVIRAFGDANKNLNYTILRIGVIYGKRYEHNFMHIFKMIKEERLKYIGNGTNHLTLINIEDVVAAILKAIENEKSSNKIYNLTDGVAYTQKLLFEKAAQLIGSEAPTERIHPFIARLGVGRHKINSDQFKFLISDRTISIEKIKRELGFKPSVSLDEGGKFLAKEFLKRYGNQ